MSNVIDPTGSVTLVTGVPALVAGTTTTVSYSAFNYVLNAVPKTRGAETNKAHPTTDVNTGVIFPTVTINKGTIIFYMVDTTGVLGAVQGTLADLDSAGKFITAPKFPAIPAGWCPFAYLVVKVDSTGGAGWTASTSNQASATGVTYTRADMYCVPTRLVAP